jgi:hypothetical protein
MESQEDLDYEIISNIPDIIQRYDMDLIKTQKEAADEVRRLVKSEECAEVKNAHGK